MLNLRNDDDQSVITLFLTKLTFLFSLYFGQKGPLPWEVGVTCNTK
jgi:hypothetical protein